MLQSLILFVLFRKAIPSYTLSPLSNGGEGRIRTSEGGAGRFTVCSLWPLGYLSLNREK